MTSPLLSIAIPTYNRSGLLGPLLADLGTLLATHGDRVQVVVCDNASTDDTAALLERLRAEVPYALKVVKRKVNLGMEGNIACAMFECDGKYVWMLSDHQRLCPANVQHAVAQMAQLEFDIGHARVLQWEPVLARRDTVVQWHELAARERGALLFSLGNLSTLVFRRELGEQAAKSIFRACVYSYPHLGVIGRFHEATRFVEFDSMSAFPDFAAAPRLVHDYDKVSVRYVANLRCVKELSRQAGIGFGESGFFTPNYRASFRGDVLHMLLQPGLSRMAAWRTLLPVMRANPASLKAVAAFVLAAILITPATARVQLAGKGKSWVIRLRNRRAASAS